MTSDSGYKTSGATCPSRQMSFADVVRYLQGGFDEPVQRTLAQHLRNCNACREEVDRVAALRRTGRHAMVTRVAADEGSGVIPESLMAAYLDGELGTEQADELNSEIAASYARYLQYSSAKSEIDAPLGAEYRTPRQVVEAMLVPAYEEAGIRLAVASWFDRVADGFSSIRSLHWPVPAAAFAIGVLLMLAVLPSGETIVALPGFTDEVGLYDDSHIRSGLGEPVEPAAIAVPVQRGHRISFTWQAADYPDPVTYRVDVAGSDVLDEPIETTDTKVTLSARDLKADSVYTVSVMARLPNGGLMPVTSQRFVLDG